MKVSQSLRRVLRPRQDQGVQQELLGSADPDQFDITLCAQAIQVSEIGDAGNIHHPDHEHIGALGGTSRYRLPRDCIFLWKTQITTIRQHAKTWKAGPGLHNFQASRQQSRIATKLINHKTFDQLGLLNGQQGHGADHSRQNSAAIDIPDKNHRRAGITCHSHIDNVVLTQIDLSRTARPFENDKIKLRRQPPIGFLNLSPALATNAAEIRCHQRSGHLSIDDQLCGALCRRFDQDRVKI